MYKLDPAFNADYHSNNVIKHMRDNNGMCSMQPGEKAYEG